MMQESSQLIKETESSIEKHRAAFISRIEHITERRKYNRWRYERSGFHALHPANPEFYTYKHYERYLEGYIRNCLINPILGDLFSIYGIEAEVLIGEDDRHVGFTNAAIEAITIEPFELIANTDNGRKGYRYTELETRSPLLAAFLADSLNLDEHDIDNAEIDNAILKRLMQYYGIDSIVVVDWSALDQSESAFDSTSNGDGRNLSDFLEHVSAAAFLRSFFPETTCKLLIEEFRAATAEANLKIGFQTIPRLSLSYRSEYNTVVTQRLQLFRNVAKEYQVRLNTEQPIRILGELQSRDLEHLNGVFFDDRLYLALLGECSFAKCFITAEYLRDVFKNGGFFDYTSVVCGYLKCVEQLMYFLMKATLEWDSTGELEISKRRLSKAEKKKRPELIQKDLIPFTRDNEPYFRTELWALAEFLYHNKRNWGLTHQGLQYVRSCLKAYKDDSRNALFHKHNIDSHEEIERIRRNTLLITFLLLGGYRIPGSPADRLSFLKADGGAYDVFHAKLLDAIGHGKGFLFDFADGTQVKARPLYCQDKTSYNDAGHVTSCLRFVVVQDFNHTEDESRLGQTNGDGTIIICRTNMPVSTKLVRYDGKLIQI